MAAPAGVLMSNASKVPLLKPTRSGANDTLLAGARFSMVTRTRSGAASAAEVSPRARRPTASERTTGICGFISETPQRVTDETCATGAVAAASPL